MSGRRHSPLIGKSSVDARWFLVGVRPVASLVVRWIVELKTTISLNCTITMEAQLMMTIVTMCVMVGTALLGRLAKVPTSQGSRESTALLCR